MRIKNVGFGVNEYCYIFTLLGFNIHMNMGWLVSWVICVSSFNYVFTYELGNILGNLTFSII